MANKSFSTKTKKNDVKFQHVALTLALTVVFFLYFFYNLLPYVSSQFVVPLFQPSLDEQEKIGFVQFDDLVWGTVAKDDESMAAGQKVSEEYLNREYIFDFTWERRTTEEHGYEKLAAQWYSKAPDLGEHAIILEPYLGFSWIAALFAVVLTLFLTIFMPSSIGLMSVLFDRQIDNVSVKLRLQTGFSDDVVQLLIMPDDKLREQDFNHIRSAFRLIWDRTITEDIASPFQSARFDDVFDEDTDVVMFRNEAIYNRIKEFFSDFVVIEIEDTKNGLRWRRNKLHFMKGFRLYMAHHFTEKYSNLVTGLAYGGAAFLIVAVGIRGLKFIPASRPSFILLAITLEFTMLSLLAITLMYTEEEERMDKMLKKMEDANRSQLEALRGQQADIHQLSNALVGQTSEIIKSRVEKAIEEYMVSGDNVEKSVADAVAKKILLTLREDNPKDLNQR